MSEKVDREGLREKSIDNRHGYVHRLDKEATSFFFTNFPDHVKAVDLWPRFARFGRVGEVFIPAKVDKQGKRFGFVKYREVKDAKELLRTISNIWIDSFKLRINLSKFNRKTEQLPNGETKRKEPEVVVGTARDGAMTTGRTFKSALLTDNASGSGIGEAEKAKDEVVWEVEVEEERMEKLEGACVGYLVENMNAQSIQNDFHMDGFQSVKVCPLGYMTVLIWSEKVEEVKEIMETVGWWCSLFEKVIPWSPDAVSNSRAVWIRCYGVPPHAWGNDLFRSIAFKHGRFLEVDASTKEMKRCDVARIKILTKDKTAIDTSMTVKVLGKRYDIRILEECGEVGTMTQFASGVRAGDTVRQGAQSSRASGDGASIQALVEGCSETGSEADVSESCQILLEIEAQGTRGTVIEARKRDMVYTESEMAGEIPNKLGNPSDLAVSLVNSVVDRGVGDFEVSAEKVLRLEGVKTGGICGDQEDEVSIGDVDLQREVEHEAVEEVEPLNVIGLAQFENMSQEQEDSISITERCGEAFRGRPGPKFLRTKKGDLCVGGPRKNGHDNLGPTTNKHLEEKSPTKALRAGRRIKTLPELPPKKMRFLSAPPYPRNRAPRRKKQPQRVTSKEAQSDSDSIQNPDEIPVISQPTTNVEFQLEVVLPCGPPVTEEAPFIAANRAGSGTVCLVNSELYDEANILPVSTSVLEVPQRQVMEARKILAIQNEVGIKIQSSQEEHLHRMEAMEVRDRCEKEDWELNRENAGFQ
jgi:hypothetical protein